MEDYTSTVPVARATKLVSPSGDLGMKDDAEQSIFFKRKIKAAGGEDHSSKRLPFRRESMVCDSKYGPGDKVV